MNPIDIEKLKRSNIYSSPPDFFAEMQESVIHAIHQETREEKSFLPLDLRWKYSVAAAVVVLFGLSVFFFNDKSEENTIASLKTTTASSQHDTDSGNRAKKIEANRPTAILSQTNNENIPETAVKIHVAAGTKASIKNTPPPPPKSDMNGIKTQHSLNENMEALLSSYSPSELAEIAGKAAPDIYLDLFD